MGLESILDTKYRERLVSASADPVAWSLALDDIVQRTKSRGAILFHRSTMPDTPVSTCAAEAMETYWRDDWMTRDIRLRAIPIQMRTGIATDYDVVSDDQIARDPLYNEFLRPFGFKWFAGIGFHVRGELWCLSIQRTPGQGHFNPDEIKVLRQFSRTMSDVGELNSLIADAKIAGLTTALGNLGDIWITFDEKGRRLESGGIAPTFLAHPSPDEARREQAVLSHAVEMVVRRAQRPTSIETDPVEAMVPAFDGRWISVRALRLGRIHSGFGRAQVLVVIRYPKTPTVLSEADLRTRFDLTLAEARVARMIASGATLRAAALSLGIAYETVRSQLKSVFHKCGIKRQAELVALLRIG